MEVEFGWVGGGGVEGVRTHFPVKSNSAELSRGCVEVEFGFWQLSQLRLGKDIRST